MREDDLLRFRWIADPRISPDGTRVAFTLVRVDADEDEYRTDLWLADVPAPGGSGGAGVGRLGCGHAPRAVSPSSCSMRGPASGRRR